MVVLFLSDRFLAFTDNYYAFLDFFGSLAWVHNFNISECFSRTIKHKANISLEIQNCLIEDVSFHVS